MTSKLVIGSLLASLLSAMLTANAATAEPSALLRAEPIGTFDPMAMLTRELSSRKISVLTSDVEPPIGTVVWSVTGNAPAATRLRGSKKIAQECSVSLTVGTLLAIQKQNIAVADVAGSALQSACSTALREALTEHWQRTAAAPVNESAQQVTLRGVTAWRPISSVFNKLSSTPGISAIDIISMGPVVRLWISGSLSKQALAKILTSVKVQGGMLVPQISEQGIDVDITAMAPSNT